jgi:hypothetical protein
LKVDIFEFDGIHPSGMGVFSGKSRYSSKKVKPNISMTLMYHIKYSFDFLIFFNPKHEENAQPFVFVFAATHSGRRSAVHRLGIRE